MGSKQSIVWGGRRWWLNGGYFCNRRGEQLHRAVYRSVHGPIPRGYDVHHIDFCKTNNDPSNLEALTRSEHLRKHQAHRSFGTREKQASRRREEWRKKEPHVCKCPHCGKSFSSTGTRAKFCSPKCRAADRRKRFPEESRGRQRNRPKKDRSPKPPRKCAICCESFKASDPRTICCSRKCGVEYRKGRLHIADAQSGLQSLG